MCTFNYNCKFNFEFFKHNKIYRLSLKFVDYIKQKNKFEL